MRKTGFRSSFNVVILLVILTYADNFKNGWISIFESICFFQRFKIPLFSSTVIKSVFRTQSNIYDKTFRENNHQLLAINYIRKKLHHSCFKGPKSYNCNNVTIIESFDSQWSSSFFTIYWCFVTICLNSFISQEWLEEFLKWFIIFWTFVRKFIEKALYTLRLVDTHLLLCFFVR